LGEVVAPRCSERGGRAAEAVSLHSGKATGGGGSWLGEDVKVVCREHRESGLRGEEKIERQRIR
jgi:hypothetical protein